jgi:hypothetical protein
MLNANVGWNSPKGFFTNRPKAIGDVVKKTTLPFCAFSKNQAAKGGAAGEVGNLIVAPVAHARKLKEKGGGECRPFIAKQGFARVDETGAYRGRQGRPHLPVAKGGIGLPLFACKEAGAKVFLRITLAKHKRESQFLPLA